MLGKKGSLIVAVLLAAAVLLTGQARLRLDAIVETIRDDFEEMMYLPRGEGLKVLACGFDTPLADALFVKGMIYYAESFQSKHKDERRSYTYDLFDVISDLSPRFHRAYQMGGLFLTSSASLKSNLDGVKLLEKGVEKYAEMEKNGQPADPDARWLFHTLIANTCETNIQIHARRSGDRAGAAGARRRAAEEFRLAAASPGAPPYVAYAAAGIEGVLAGKGGMEDSHKAVLAVWKFLEEEAIARGDEDILPDLRERIDNLEHQISSIQITRELENLLADAGREYIKKTGNPPSRAEDLVGKNLIPGLPNVPLSTGESRDEWLALPDGAFKSRLLAAMDTSNDMDRLVNAVIDYRKVYPSFPSNPEELVDGGFIDALPEPPLGRLGQRYEYNPKTGTFTNIMPEGMESE